MGVFSQRLRGIKGESKAENEICEATIHTLKSNRVVLLW